MTITIMVIIIGTPSKEQNHELQFRLCSVFEKPATGGRGGGGVRRRRRRRVRQNGWTSG
jgi:hypothetical protein